MMLLSHTNYHTVHHHGPRQNRFTGGGTDCTVFSEGFFSTEVNVDPTVRYCTLHGSTYGQLSFNYRSTSSSAPTTSTNKHPKIRRVLYCSRLTVSYIVSIHHHQCQQ